MPAGTQSNAGCWPHSFFPSFLPSLLHLIRYWNKAWDTLNDVVPRVSFNLVLQPNQLGKTNNVQSRVCAILTGTFTNHRAFPKSAEPIPSTFSYLENELVTPLSYHNLNLFKICNIELLRTEQRNNEWFFQFDSKPLNYWTEGQTYSKYLSSGIEIVNVELEARFTNEEDLGRIEWNTFSIGI